MESHPKKYQLYSSILTVTRMGNDSFQARKKYHIASLIISTAQAFYIIGVIFSGLCFFSLKCSLISFCYWQYTRWHMKINFTKQLCAFKATINYRVQKLQKHLRSTFKQWIKSNFFAIEGCINNKSESTPFFVKKEFRKLRWTASTAWIWFL